MLGLSNNLRREFESFIFVNLKIICFSFRIIMFKKNQYILTKRNNKTFTPIQFIISLIFVSNVNLSNTVHKKNINKSFVVNLSKLSNQVCGFILGS